MCIRDSAGAAHSSFSFVRRRSGQCADAFRYRNGDFLDVIETDQCCAGGGIGFFSAVVEPIFEVKAGGPDSGHNDRNNQLISEQDRELVIARGTGDQGKNLLLCQLLKKVFEQLYPCRLKIAAIDDTVHMAVEVEIGKAQFSGYCVCLCQGNETP